MSAATDSYAEALPFTPNSIKLLNIGLTPGFDLEFLCMKRLACLICLGVNLLLPVSPRAADGPVVTPFQFKSFAANCLQLLQAEKWPELAGLYHVPPSADFDPAREREEIATTLSALGTAFGHPVQAEYTDAVVEIAQLTVEGLDRAYWQDHSKSVQVSYRAAFSEMGQGYVSFSIVVYANHMQLRSVSFGFLAADPETPGRMKALRKLLGG